MIEAGTLSYGLAAIAFAALAVLLGVSWRGRIQGALLTLAAIIAGLWAGLAAAQVAAGRPISLLVEVTELARSGLWLAFALVLLAGARSRDTAYARALRVAALGLGGFLALLTVLTLLLSPGWLASSSEPHFFTGILGRWVLALAGIVLIEQLYRNVAAQQRWGIKFLCLGLGGLFAYDFTLYSDALLLRRIDATLWDARGVVNALCVPLIAVSAARNPQWSLDISVSRRVIFHSASIIGAGVYLLGMSAAGYYIRFFGGQWGGLFQVTFLFAAGVLLVIVLFSGTARARLKVFLSKHFFSYRYDYREEWLRFTRRLAQGEPGVQLRERSIEAIAELVESPGGTLWLQGEGGRFERLAHWNMPQAAGALDADDPLVRFLAAREWAIDLDECLNYPEHYDDLQLPEVIRALPRAWLVVPLMLHERLIGFVVLARSRGRITLNWEVSDLLRTGGRQAAGYLAQLEAASALLVARQFESFNRMSAFVVHDIKNLVSQLSLLLTNARKHRDNPEFQEDMLETLGLSVEKMKRLLEQLKSANPVPEPASVLALAAIAEHAVEAQRGLAPEPSLETSDGDSPLVLASRERLVRVVGHLVRNAIEATAGEGRVAVKVSAQADSGVVEITDTGQGMSAEFVRDRLFRPFSSTKPSGMGVGTYECRQYVQELGGRIEVESEPGRGTTFRVILPRADAPVSNVIAMRSTA